MTRSIRRRQWHGVLAGGLLLLAAPTFAWAQTNTFPTSGNAGVGTTTPAYKLEVVAPNSHIHLSTSTADSGGYLASVIPDNLAFSGGATFISPNWIAKATSASIIASFLGGIHIYADTGLTVGAAFNPSERLTILPNGNIGMGTVNPASKFHVAGDVQVDGNLAAKYQDVAEWVMAPVPVSPGVVVVVDPKARNQVLPASVPYDTRVAGVVSLRPGLLLGEAGDNKAKVAHSGRVKVKVDASYGPIEAGDLLVTSPTSGYAMRSVPVELGGTLIHRPGTVLGKALEPLDTGQGEILVLLTLQ